MDSECAPGGDDAIAHDRRIRSKYPETSVAVSLAIELVIGDADLTDTYFDITTSGQSHGVGNNTGYPGVTGLTTEEFQAGLPEGFGNGVWAQDPNINGGLPYLTGLPTP